MIQQASLSYAQTYWLDYLAHADQFNAWVFEQISPYLGDRVLEIGCGTGNFTVPLAHRCRHLTAVDLDADYVATARSRLPHAPHVDFFTGDATQMEWSDRFDTVILLDVLEHIEQDAEFLHRLRHVLNPGGRLILKVPAGQRLYSSLDANVGHYRRYNKTSITQVLDAAHFTPEHLRYFNMAGIPGWWVNGSVLKRTVPSSGQVGLFNRLVPLFKAMEQRIEPPRGLSLIAIATPI